MAYAGTKPVYTTVETQELATNVCSTPLALTVGNNNNTTLTAAYSVFHVTLAGSGCVLTGIVPDTRNGASINGQVKVLINTDSTNSFSITNQDTNSTAANRIVTGQATSLIVGPGESVNFLYDTTTSLWAINGGSASQAFASNVATAMAIVFG